VEKQNVTKVFGKGKDGWMCVWVDDTMIIMGKKEERFSKFKSQQINLCKKYNM